MFGIIVISRGMFAGTRWVRSEDDEIELYTTRAAAEKAADRYNAMQGPVNHFCDYFAEEYEEV